MVSISHLPEQTQRQIVDHRPLLDPRTARLKRLIDAGAYEDDHKLDIAADRLLDDLSPAATPAPAAGERDVMRCVSCREPFNGIAYPGPDGHRCHACIERAEEDPERWDGMS